MTAPVLLALFGVGLVVGLTSGLIGIGGGVLIVPFLYFFYAHPGWSGAQVAPDLEAAVAHATSLFIIVPTAVRGALWYHRAGLVEWRAALPVGVASILSAVLGARLALVLPEHALKFSFGFVLIWSGVQLFRSRDAAPAGEPRREIRAWKAVATGLLVGVFSALLGVGGGAIAIPLLVYVVGVELRRVAATSLAIVTLSATAGAFTYVVSGTGAEGLPPGSLGYVHVLAALPILAGSVLSVGVGTWLNQRLPATGLRAVFAAVFLLLGLKLLIENAAHLG